jgi:Acyl-CoA reductase (LuxC)
MKPRPVSLMAGHMNQTACSSTRVVYVECDPSDEQDLSQLEAFGRTIHQAFGQLDPSFSTEPKAPAPDLQEEMDALEVDDEFFRIIGDTQSAGVVVSRTEDPVDFAGQLRNRVINLVPVPDITRVAKQCDDGTQTVGVYPESLRERLRDDLALHGCSASCPPRRRDGSNPMPIPSNTSVHRTTASSPCAAWSAGFWTSPQTSSEGRHHPLSSGSDLISHEATNISEHEA